MRRGYLLLLLPVVLLAACEPGPEVYEQRAATMGTELIVRIDGRSRQLAESAANAAIEEVERINQLMSTWIEDSPLSRLNREAARDWAQANPEIFFLLQQSIEYSRRTDGAFDVTAGALVRLWGFFAREHQRPPTDEHIAETLKATGFELIELDPKTLSVRFSVPGVEIDFGAIAKGYAVDRAITVLETHGVTSGLVNLGGNIGTIGAPAGRQDWTVAVRDPRSKSELLGTLRLDGGSSRWGIASSGQYERFFIYEGKRYGHIIDPRTGFPVEGILGTTIVAPNATRADALSTAVFVLGPEKGRAFVAESEDILGLVILPAAEDGLSVYVSPRLADRFELLDGVTGATIRLLEPAK